MICENLLFFGIYMDKKMNSRLVGKKGSFHSEKSQTALLVIPTNEELEIARETETVIKS
jgi:acetate kinase